MKRLLNLTLLILWLISILEYAIRTLVSTKRLFLHSNMPKSLSIQIIIIWAKPTNSSSSLIFKSLKWKDTNGKSLLLWLNKTSKIYFKLRNNSKKVLPLRNKPQSFKTKCCLPKNLLSCLGPSLNQTSKSSILEQFFKG